MLQEKVAHNAVELCMTTLKKKRFGFRSIKDDLIHTVNSHVAKREKESFSVQKVGIHFTGSSETTLRSRCVMFQSGSRFCWCIWISPSMRTFSALRRKDVFVICVHCHSPNHPAHTSLTPPAPNPTPLAALDYTCLLGEGLNSSEIVISRALLASHFRSGRGGGNGDGHKAKYIIPPMPVIMTSRRFEMTV